MDADQGDHRDWPKSDVQLPPRPKCPICQNEGLAVELIERTAHVCPQCAVVIETLAISDHTSQAMLHNLGVLEQNVKILEKQADALKNDRASLAEQIELLANFLLERFGGPHSDCSACELAVEMLKKACWFDHGGTDTSLLEHWHKLLHAVWPGCGGSVEIGDVVARATRAREAVEGVLGKPEGFAEIERKILRSLPPHHPKRALLLLQAEFAWMTRERSRVKDKNGAVLMASACQRVTELLLG